MYIERIPNRNSPPAVLLRESYREQGKVKKRTIANLSKLPDEVVDNLKLVLKGATAVKTANLPENFEVIRSLPHGHVSAILKTIRDLELDLLIDDKKTRKRSLIEAMIIARIINPASKLATARGVDLETCSSSIGQVLGVEKVTANELYESLDYLILKQEKIESKLAEKHLMDGSLILYDVTSTYVEGEHCSLAKYGYNRDKKKGKAQIIFGLICDKYGIYIIRTSVPAEKMDSKSTLKNYKSLSKVEEAFRCYKTIDLNVRPIYHYKDERVKAHIFLCMLAYYVEWHMKEKLKSMLFEDEELVEINEEQLNFSRSESGKEKDRKKRNKENDVVHSFRTLLEDLGTITLNKIRVILNGEKIEFEKVTKPTLLQEKILKLLGVSLYCTQ